MFIRLLYRADEALAWACHKRVCILLRDTSLSTSRGCRKAAHGRRWDKVAAGDEGSRRGWEGWME